MLRPKMSSVNDQEAFDSGLGGLKLHAHVQCFDMNGEHMNRLYEWQIYSFYCSFLGLRGCSCRTCLSVNEQIRDFSA